MKNAMPNHAAIILDGNGRWATRQGLPRTAGHKAGFERLKKTSKYILSKGIKYLSVFAFSTENFKRSQEEVDYLMNLFMTGFKKERTFFKKNNIRVIFSGRDKPLSDEVLKSMRTLEEETKDNTNGILNICLNYGGQAEIVDASKRLMKLYKEDKVKLEDINEESFYHYLYNDLPPIDLLIRTSGEIRISNFMLYELSYAELYFTSTCFPDFDEKEFDKALEDYQNRHITNGGNK